MKVTLTMRKPHYYLALAAVVSILASGCAGPEEKLGRGLRNMTEFARMGELTRTMEQTALWDSPQHAYTTGFIRGMHRTMARTAIGVWETATFMIPTKSDGTYDAILTPKGVVYPDITIKNYNKSWGGLALTEDPIYPDSYKPSLPPGSMWDTDTKLGFRGGDVTPFVPGSRWSVFEGE